ncbi:DnaD domain protein [Paenibacillus terrigena]|uniref:DnaD domain protein n=1 Tax=Paenibacillus terrigena TaxID=369333 RepID=UPI0028D174E8|nr:DnaD domain protein [Paenibacillus terrigena]
MRISNLMQFTEHHRYCTFRDFSLSGMDSKMLSYIYQPMVGGLAISFYQFLYQHISSDRVGYSRIEQQRRLFLTLGIDPSEKGRKQLIEITSKLEAVGLLHTSRIYIPEQDDSLYEYELFAPLSPNEFFKTQHLTLLLRDKVGKFTVLSLREEFCTEEPAEIVHKAVHKEDLSIPFYELFQLNTQVIDYELEQALSEVAPSRHPGYQATGSEEMLNYADIISRFPRISKNRAFVERLRYEHEQMGMINYIVHKYQLSLQDICGLLDEEGVFSDQGEVLLDELQQRANLQFRQGKKRSETSDRYAKKVIALRDSVDLTGEDQPQEEYAVEMEFYLDVPPQFQGKCDIHQYNMMLRNEPYTMLLKKFFPGSVPDNMMDMFEKIDLNYKLPEEVINVLIHYLMTLLVSGTDQRLNRNFVDSIASTMLMKQITTYELAVQHIRDQSQFKQRLEQERTSKSAASGSRGRSGSGYSRSAKQKPSIPIIQDVPQGMTVTPEELEEMRKVARKLDGKS